MTTFVDGPAKGQTLMLHRAVKYLRVVKSKKGWDALDQPEDTPEPGEQLFAYQITEPPGFCHIRATKRAAIGFYAIASYKLCPVQPMEQMMRDSALWSHWCEHRPDPCPQWDPFHAK